MRKPVGVDFSHALAVITLLRPKTGALRQRIFGPALRQEILHGEDCALFIVRLPV